MADRTSHPVGFQTLTVSDTAIGLTVPPTAEAAYLTCETNDVRYRFDGGDPTSTVGHVLAKGQAPVLMQSRQILLALRMIRQGSGDSVLSCTYVTIY